MKPQCIFAAIAFVAGTFSASSGAQQNYEALDAAQMQRRMQEEQTMLEGKQASSPEEPTTAPKQLRDRGKLNADQRRAQEQLQQQQLLLDAATKNTPRISSSPVQANHAPAQNQLFELERKQQDLSFDIQRQQLHFRQRSGQ